MSQYQKVCPDKLCLAKGPQLLSAFPLNCRRPDGHHLYCKACCRRRVHEGRVNQRERRAVRKKIEQEKRDRQVAAIGISRPRKQLDCDERVWIAIALSGARTQRQIQRAAQVSTKDELGLALAELMLGREWIKSELIEGGTERVYFPNPARTFNSVNNRFRDVSLDHQYGEDGQWLEDRLVGLIVLKEVSPNSPLNRPGSNF